jgi:hypothetical protein
MNATPKVPKHLLPKAAAPKHQVKPANAYNPDDDW